MNPDNASTEDALHEINTLIDDYAHHRRDAYFSHFSEDATFVFHTSPARLDNRRAYEGLWQSWESVHDFRVLSCESTNRKIQRFGPTVIFTHDVDTVLSMDGVTERPMERETIVMQLTAKEWSCIHEHLSGRDA